MNSLTGAGIASLLSAILIKIDKGIPIPDHFQGERPIYPWREMAVGDSFKYVPTRYKKRKRSIKEIHATCSGNATFASHRLYPRKFICRKHKGHLRVWRIK